MGVSGSGATKSCMYIINAGFGDPIQYLGGIPVIDSGPAWSAVASNPAADRAVAIS